MVASKSTTVIDSFSALKNNYDNAQHSGYTESSFMLSDCVVPSRELKDGVGNTVNVNLTEVPTAIVKANGIGLLDGLQAKKIYSKSQKLEYGMLDYTKFQDFILSE